MNGEFPDLSKKYAFAPYLDLPARVPEAKFELAMNINADDPERSALMSAAGRWSIRIGSREHRRGIDVTLHRPSQNSPRSKGVDVTWQTGWLSDRAAAFLALGRPVITEDTGAEPIPFPRKRMFVS